MEGTDGVLYGTAYGNEDTPNAGAVFKLNKDGTGYQVLHTFNSGAGDGLDPAAGVVQGTNGVLYGTTAYGNVGPGTLFEINPEGTDFAILYTFCACFGDGQIPVAGLVQASDGQLYGTAVVGGAASVSSALAAHAMADCSNRSAA